MAKNRTRQPATPCVELGADLRAGLDAADAAAVEAVIHDRPMCPQVEATSSGYVGVRLPDGVIVGIGAWGETCPACARGIHELEHHPLLASDTTRRQGFLRRLHEATVRRYSHG
jgi:DNA-binding transcriptional regulator LsrR (DeoR family)